jgi:rod shape-determining protein MreC
LVTGNNRVGGNFSEQTALTARLMLYGLLAVVLMAMDHRGQYVPRFRSVANQLVEPAYHVVEWPIRALRGVFGFFRSSQSLRRSNEELREQLLQQQGLLQRLEAITGENDRLREMVDNTTGPRFEYQFAELIGVDLDPFSHKIIIDRGADKGIFVGQAVIDGAGVMGQVEDVQAHFSTVRLISDPNHALPVQINRTGLRSVAYGTGSTAQLSLPSVLHEADVRVGDLIVTSGLGDRFPGGYPVAVVSAIDRREGYTFEHVLATPLAALDRGREVLLIVSVSSDDSPEVDQADDQETGLPIKEVAAEVAKEVDTAEVDSAEADSVEADSAAGPDEDSDQVPDS